MQKNKNRFIVLAIFASLSVGGCSTYNSIAVLPQADMEPASIQSANAVRLLPDYEGNYTAPPWTRYRSALYLPDPDHRTLEAENVHAVEHAPAHHGADEQNAPTGADAETRDLWHRLRAGYAFPEYDNPRIQAEMAWYVDHPAYMTRTVERARPYIHFIVEELERRGMPLEIALLPIVESAYQPFAYSHGRAAGLWQFIPSTATLYGLKQTWWYDGRRDVVESTRAALDYLEYLNRYFDGDWLLALAAYNSGEGTVRRAVSANVSRGQAVDFWSLNLPRETRAYVPKLLALSELFANPANYALELESIPDEPFVARVDIGSQIDLAKAAELADISLDEMYRLNPAFNRWATDPDGPHELLLPIGKADDFYARLSELGSGHRVSWTRHLIREGETLGQIAQRYDTTVGVLRQVNNVKNHVIRAGQNLVIPVSMKDADSYGLSMEQRRITTQGVAHSPTRIEHIVRNGDTLWDISRRHGVDVKKLAEWNSMAPRDVLRPGQRLVIWKKDVVNTDVSAFLDDAHPATAATRRINYVVRKGDSLSRISQRFNVRIAELRQWNALSPDEHLHPGQALTLYVNVTRLTANL